MQIKPDIKLDFDDVLIEPKRSTISSREEVDIQRMYNFKYADQWTGIPIIAANMSTVGTLSMAYAMQDAQMMCALHKFVTDIPTSEDKLWADTFHTIGLDDWEHQSFGNYPYPYLCLDVANGYQQRFVEFVRDTRRFNPNAVIMAGNVCTGSMTEELILAGADIVKVGIGPGMACRTRDVTGVGIPQLSAIMECADAAHGLEGHICADGGCKKTADVVKAFAAGADFVMLGYMLAGHDECEGKIVENPVYPPRVRPPSPPHINWLYNDDFKPTGSSKTMLFYGMSSEEAMETFNGGMKNYRASEGVSMAVEYKGPVKSTLQQITGGLRSACSYTGARTLRELSKRTTFVRLK